MHIENGIQLRELQQVGHLAPRIAQFELAPWLAFGALALRTGVPITFLILEYSGSAFCTRRLSNGTERHDQFTETTAVDIGDVFEVEQDFVVPFGNLISDRLAQRGERLARCDLTGEIDNEYRVRPSGAEFEFHVFY